MFARSRARRLISAGEPAPSQMTASKRARRPASASSTGASSLRLQRLVGARGRVGERPAHQQDLRRRVARGLDQHGVHRRLGLDPARGGLHRLRAADLGARRGDRRVVGHVLGLERRDAHAAPRERAADARGDQRLAGVRRGAADEERAGSSTTPRVSATSTATSTSLPVAPSVSPVRPPKARCWIGERGEQRDGRGGQRDRRRRARRAAATPMSDGDERDERRRRRASGRAPAEARALGSAAGGDDHRGARRDVRGDQRPRGVRRVQRRQRQRGEQQRAPPSPARRARRPPSPSSPPAAAPACRGRRARRPCRPARPRAARA